MLGFHVSIALFTSLQLSPSPPVQVRVDSARGEVVVTLGPTAVPMMPTGVSHEQLHGAPGHGTPLLRFAWPVTGWVRGFEVRLRDGNGGALPRRLLHHVNLIHMERRQLQVPVLERIIAAGQETEGVELPRTIGIRLEAGADLGLLAAWANETGSDLASVVLELRLRFMAANTIPAPVEVRPLGFDVGFRAGETDAFDLLPGRHEYIRDYSIPVDGRLLAAGGHLHDYAVSLDLVELKTGRRLVSLRPTLDDQGRILSVSRQLFGISGEGKRLRAGRRYRVIAVYDNPTPDTLVGAGMAVIGGLFAPTDPRAWPALDRTDFDLLRDLAGLDRLGQTAASHEHAGHH